MTSDYEFEAALERMSAELAGHLGQGSERLADVAHTLQTGRARFPWRRFVVSGRPEEAAVLLGGSEPGRVRTAFDDVNRCARGAYVLAEAEGRRLVSLLATGSEVAIALEARAGRAHLTGGHPQGSSQLVGMIEKQHPRAAVELADSQDLAVQAQSGKGIFNHGRHDKGIRR